MGTMRQGDEHRSPPEAAAVCFGNRWLKGFLLAFCCWHALFLVCSIIPVPPTRENPGNPAVALYRLALGGRQEWNVFNSIPTVHSMDAWLEHEDEKGEKNIVGCVLPGFKTYPVPEETRCYQIFWRLAFFSDGLAFQEAYLKKAAQLLSSQRDPGARGKWSLVMDVEYTRTLALISRDGKLSLPITKTFDLPALGGSAP